MPHQESPSRKSQVYVYGFLGIMALFTVVFGFSNLSRTINKSSNDRERIQQEAREQELFSEIYSEEVQLRNSDTDEDGLSDYDEITFYSTSPYLPDTDSDGFDDKQEIEQGHDPNCPVGVNCRNPGDITTEVDGSIFSDVGADQFQDLLNAGEEIPVQEELDVSNLTIDELRALLIASGEISESQLNQIDDETLNELYQQTLGEGVPQGVTQ